MFDLSSISPSDPLTKIKASTQFMPVFYSALGTLDISKLPRSDTGARSAATLGDYLLSGNADPHFAKYGTSGSMIYAWLAFFMDNNISAFLKVGQTETNGKPYCSAVPFGLAAFKQYQGIKYSEWDWQDPSIKGLCSKKINSELLPYIVGQYELPTITKEHFEAFSTQYTVRDAISAATKRKCGIQELDSMPHLLRCMIFRTWVYSGHISPLMICNIKALDSVFENSPISSVRGAW